MKIIISILFIFISTQSFAAGGFDCRDEYKKFLMSTRSWGSDQEYKQFMNAQNKEGKKLLSQVRFNKSSYLKWKKMLYQKAAALINEAYSRQSTPLVNRISSKGKISKRYIFNFLKKGNRDKSLCDGKPLDFNQIALAIVLSHQDKK